MMTWHDVASVLLRQTLPEVAADERVHHDCHLGGAQGERVASLGAGPGAEDYAPLSYSRDV